MYQVKRYCVPETVDEAAQLLQSNQRGRLVGGNMFLRMTSAVIPVAIDLSRCGLDYIRREENGEICLGAMCTLRRLETAPVIRRYCGGILSRAAGEIVGVQFRNLATVGASVFSKYGFSDVITPLLACGARVRLYFQGELSLEEFLKQPRRRDLLREVVLPAGEMAGAFVSLRIARGDFSMLNTAAVRTPSGWRLAVGARPLCAALAYSAMDALDGAQTDIPGAARMAAEELSFGSNTRASAGYRQEVCRVLAERAIRGAEEVGA